MLAGLGRLPLAVLGLYAAASVVAFLAYGHDKSAAVRDAWRVKENTLHLFALLGGWPGRGGAAAVPPQVFQGLVPDDVLDHRGAQLRGARLAAVTLWGADVAGDAGGGLSFRPLPHSPRH